MNFNEFQGWREKCLRSQPGLKDCGETNLYRALAFLQPQPSPESPSHRVHRCDLARAWLHRYGFPESSSRLALVSRGVRHALGLIFRELARTKTRLCIPADVYPVYLELAHGAGIEPQQFPTLPQPDFSSLPQACGAEYLLVANPWKPLGRFLNDDECGTLRHWLAASPDRRLLMDCVYDLGVPFHNSTRSLLQTGRVILLHSVTKGWLWPKTFGVALLGEPWTELESAFRADAPNQNQLHFAGELLACHAQLPDQIAAELARRKNNLLAALPTEIAKELLPDTAAAVPGGYLFPVKPSADDLLNQHGLLAIPASVFGGNWCGSVLASLSEPFANHACETKL